jgi:predicted ABC-type ATPase
MNESATPKPSIYVIAGPNGGGKSSIIGEMLLRSGADYFNPDLIANPSLPREQANSLAWTRVRDYLKEAIETRATFAFETTLGGNTIPGLLEHAIAEGIEVRIWFTCLSSVELHIERVRARVDEGGHDIPEQKIRERYEASRKNLIRLLPKLTELRLYDNSFNAQFSNNIAPKPRLILHLQHGRIITSCDLAETPDWAKPIVETVLKLKIDKTT